MDEKDIIENWEVQKKLNIWDEKRRANETLEELFEGKVRYLKIINRGMGTEALHEALKEFVNDMYDKNMSGLTKLGAGFLVKVAKKTLLSKIITSFFINMQHMVNLKCLKKLELYSDRTELVIHKCTAKRAWKLGIRNNKMEDILTAEDYCKFLCVPLFNRLLEVAKAGTKVEFQKRGCEQVIQFLNK
ncbi:MAG: hypothetical protein HWN65_01850 [Candidatus Helarchaeota archaeon]|nr:hypothetical protein [Candidatus Helarchaeota archaeon]